MDICPIRKAVITGPTGVVGMSLIHELISRRIEVVAVCRRGSARVIRIPESPYVQIAECDLSALLSLSKELSDDYDAFFHCAWIGTTGAARQDADLQSKNILYTVDAVTLAKRLGCKVFVGAGSQAEYGLVDGVLHPDTPCFPNTGYGIAKLAAGQMSRLACQNLGMRHIWARILSIYGPYDGINTMVMSTVRKMLCGEPQQFTKGEQLWDYLYSKDAAKALYLMARCGRNGATYCLGSSKPRLLRDYIYAIRDAAAPSLSVGIGELDYYPNQVMHLEADISSLREDTGFCPMYTFEEGIVETVQWAKEHPDTPEHKTGVLK